MCWQAPKQRPLSIGRVRAVAIGSSKAGGRAQGDGRCDGDNEDARRCDDETKICRTGEVDIGREQWQQTAFTAWERQSRGRELGPKVDDLQASTSSTSSVGLGGRITDESAPRAPMPQRVQREDARAR